MPNTPWPPLTDAACDIRSPRDADDWLQASAMLHDYVAWLGAAAGVDPLEEQPGLATELSELASVYSDGSAELLLAFDGRLAVGTIACRYHDQHTAELKRMYVRPVARGRGHAGRLVARLLDVIAATGRSRVWLETTHGIMDPALAVYRQHGFVETTRRHTTINVDDMVVLERAITPAQGAPGPDGGTMDVSFTDEMRQMVDVGLGFVATVNDDGTPNVSPKGTLTVWSDHQLAYADIASPRTTANLTTRPAIEVNVVDPLIRRGYRFSGTATAHRSGEQFTHGLQLYDQRGTVEVHRRVRSIVVIDVTQVRPLRSPAYALGAAEAELKNHYLAQLTGTAKPPGR